MRACKISEFSQSARFWFANRKVVPVTEMKEMLLRKKPKGILEQRRIVQKRKKMGKPLAIRTMDLRQMKWNQGLQ